MLIVPNPLGLKVSVDAIEDAGIVEAELIRPPLGSRETVVLPGVPLVRYTLPAELVIQALAELIAVLVPDCLAIQVGALLAREIV